LSVILGQSDKLNTEFDYGLERKSLTIKYGTSIQQTDLRVHTNIITSTPTTRRLEVNFKQVVKHFEHVNFKLNGGLWYDRLSGEITYENRGNKQISNHKVFSNSLNLQIAGQLSIELTKSKNIGFDLIIGSFIKLFNHTKNGQVYSDYKAVDLGYLIGKVTFKNNNKITPNINLQFWSKTTFKNFRMKPTLGIGVERFNTNYIFEYNNGDETILLNNHLILLLNFGFEFEF
jgi:hypothetical protein